MNIIYDKVFEKELTHIIDYIALDKISAAITFATELEELIKEIPTHPFKYRQSLYFNDDNIRDMTYKKYTITYEVNLNKNRIEILKIFNKNKPKETQS